MSSVAVFFVFAHITRNSFTSPCCVIKQTNKFSYICLLSRSFAASSISLLGEDNFSTIFTWIVAFHFIDSRFFNFHLIITVAASLITDFSDLQITLMVVISRTITKKETIATYSSFLLCQLIRSYYYKILWCRASLFSLSRFLSLFTLSEAITRLWSPIDNCQLHIFTSHKQNALHTTTIISQLPQFVFVIHWLNKQNNLSESIGIELAI